MTTTNNLASFTTTSAVDRNPLEVYEAITDVRRWWTGEISGSAEHVGDEFTYRFGRIHDSRQRVTELEAGRRIVWRVVEAGLWGRQTPDEWVGTHIIFDLEPTDGGTNVRFTHEGLVRSFECYDDCVYAWTFFVDTSLRRLITTGEGPAQPPWA